MKKNLTKFLLALLVVGGGFHSCKKVDVDLQNTEDYSEYPHNNENAILDEMARTIAKSLANKDFRVLVKTEALKKIDGDYDIHYADFSEMELNNVTISEIIESNVSFGKKGVNGLTSFTALSNEIPNFQLSVPINAEIWDTDSIVPLVSYMPIGVNDTDVKWMKAYDSNGKLYMLDAKTPPDFPVVVIGSSERRGQDGSLLKFITEEEAVNSFSKANSYSSVYITKASFSSLSAKRKVEPWGNGDAEVKIFCVWINNQNNLVANSTGDAWVKLFKTWGDFNWWHTRYWIEEQSLNETYSYSNWLSGSEIKLFWIEDDGGSIGFNDAVQVYHNNKTYRPFFISGKDDWIGYSIKGDYSSYNSSKGYKHYTKKYYSFGGNDWLYFYIR